ncbi:unnamed protein product [Durusdinium trenchii]|uniref:Ethanolaminephosphotransferase n=1 Tax=Durusdinium trenchii TaxID=1381693 RepID=A0ABP0S4N3_9DINO
MNPTSKENDNEEPCPSWLWLVLAACTFAYQTLDNIDGKQARRTNSSSALGLFIDHGADALNIILTSQNAMALLQLGQRETCWATLAIWTATSTPFFFATWEEHFTGSLYLGLFNGPTDGVLIVCASYVVTALSSPGFWSGQCVLGMSRAECMIFFYLVCVFFTVSANIYSVQQKLSSSRHLGAGLSLTIPFLLHLLFGYWMLGPLHPTETNTRLSLWFLGFCFLILVSALQLANVCGERYKPWRWTLTVLACLLADYILKRGSLWIATTLLLLIWLHFVIQVANEMADILRISIFTLTRNNEKRRAILPASGRR